MLKKKHPDYQVWQEMRRRCVNKKRKDYINYRARGIGYDKEWEDFCKFIADMGPRPSKLYSIDRIDVDKGYSKDNCRWLLKSQQSANRRIAKACYKGHPWTEENTISTHNGKTKTRICKICRDERLLKKSK